MIEVEIKVKIGNPEDIRKRFEKYNGRYKISLIHEDAYYNMPKGLRDFEKTDEALRIRKSIEFNKNIGLSKKDIVYFIAYKGKKVDPITKTRKELETKVDNGELMKELLKTLGFQEILTVNKERELYDFEFEGYHIEALLDYLPMLKEHFMEVEALIDSNDKLNETRDVLFKFLNKIGIKKEESIRKSYLELILDRLKDN